MNIDRIRKRSIESLTITLPDKLYNIEQKERKKAKPIKINIVSVQLQNFSCDEIDIRLVLLLVLFLNIPSL